MGYFLIRLLGFGLPALIVGFIITMQYNSLIVWHGDDYKCNSGRRFYDEVPKQRLIAIGSISFLYQPKTFGCPEPERYDPSKYEVVNGILQGKE